MFPVTMVKNHSSIDVLCLDNLFRVVELLKKDVSKSSIDFDVVMFN